MATKTRKAKASGRFGAGYGLRSRKRLNKVESLQRKKQRCPFCEKEKVKRMAKGIWQCNGCGKRFSSGIFNVK